MERPRILTHIFTSPEKGAPIQINRRATVVNTSTHKGLFSEHGYYDRYALGGGAFSNAGGAREVTDITIISAQALEGTPFTPALTRRSLVVDMSVEDLMRLTGQTFTIGEASFEGAGPCDPCQRPSRLSNIPDFPKHFGGNNGYDAGLRAKIIHGGEIQIGDVFVLSTENNQPEDKQLQ